MSKLDNLDKILIILFIVGVTMAIITSCQTKKHPLSEAVFPCECIYKSTTQPAIKFKCQDGEYYFVDPDYHKAIKQGEIITEPLNK